MSYFSPEYKAFFDELKLNNHKDWFQANKKRYEQHVKKPFERFVADVLADLAEQDERYLAVQAKDLIFRINRDIRFSNDKRPYKESRAAAISPYGKKIEMPGYYISFSAQHVMIGGGCYELSTKNLFKVRQEIAYNLKEFDKLINEKTFKKTFGEIRGEAHKRAPKEFKEEAEQQPLILNKQFIFMVELKPEVLWKKDIKALVLEHIEIGKPMYQFLERALAEV